MVINVTTTIVGISTHFRSIGFLSAINNIKVQENAITEKSPIG